MKDLTITGFAMSKLRDINKQIEECKEQLNRLYGIKRQLRLDPIDTSKWNSNKIYKFRIPEYDEEWSDELYIGIITDIWYSETDGKYMVEFCAIYENLIHDSMEYADCQWGGFDAYMCSELDESQVKRLVNYLEEMSFKEFNKYMNEVFCTRLQERALYWIDAYMNKDTTDEKSKEHQEELNQ